MKLFMFKHKSSPIVLAILFIVICILVFIVYRSSCKELEKGNNLMKNNIEFSGIITNLNVSGNHAFGILQLKITETNRNLFKSSLGSEIYPYTIKDSVAEIYTHIALPEIEKGYKVVVNSNNQTITVYDGYKFLYEWEISMVIGETDMEFVKKYSILQ
jgi:hypothetical protein